MKRAWALIGTFVGLLSSLNASAGPLAAFNLEQQTAHVAVYARENRSPDARKIEAKLVQLTALLGASEVPHVNYYSYQSAGDIAAITGRYAEGLTYPSLGQVHSTSEATDHELVHVVSRQLGSPGTFFEEGLAVALGNHGKWNGRDVDEVAKRSAAGGSIEPWIARFDAVDPSVGYAIAGSFVKYLIKQHGVERVASFFRRCPSQQAAAAVFASCFGESIDAAGVAWERQL